MKIEVDPSSLTETKWHEYAVRFVFGGLITAVAGLIAKKYGPAIGGLFLAFPAIFPASATLVEKHEQEKKEKAGLKGIDRAAEATSIDSAGAAIGSLGLGAFAAFVWRVLPSHSVWLTLSAATLVWMTASFCLWATRKRA